MNARGLTIRFATELTALLMLTGCLQPLASSPLTTPTATPTLSLTEQLGTAIAVVQTATAQAVMPTTKPSPTSTQTASLTPRSTFTPISTGTFRPTATPAITHAPTPLEPGKILGVYGSDLCIFDERGHSTPLGLVDRFANYDGASWSPDGLRIVFAACLLQELDDPDCKDLFTANPDGSQVKPVVRNPSTDIRLPAWSPNGEWIAYIENCGLSLIRPDSTGRRAILIPAGKYCLSGVAWAPDSQRLAWLRADFDPATLVAGPVNTVWVAKPDGSGEVRSIFQSDDVQLVAGRIAWSPDGQSVAVMLENDTAYLINADCTNLPNGCDQASRTEIDAFPKHWLPAFYPPWAGEEGATLPSPENTPTPALAGPCRIAFERDGDIYVRDCDGTQVRRLTDHPTEDAHPTWSPDGQRLVFASSRDRQPWSDMMPGSLYIVNVDTSHLVRLTSSADFNDASPAWSPDGSRIAFHRNCSLVTINPDGSNVKTILSSNEEICIEAPVWSPDSRRLAFANDRPAPGDYNTIYIVDADGTKLVKLARFQTDDARPAWSPDGQQLGVWVYREGEAPKHYLFSADGSSELVEVESIPDSWYPWYWPQWGR